MHNKIKIFFSTLSLSLLVALTPALGGIGFAQLPKTEGGSGSSSSSSTASNCAANDALCAQTTCANNQASNCVDCNKTACSDRAAGSRTCQNDPDHTNCDLIADYINPTIKILNILVGIFAVISIAYAGIQYSMAGGDPQKVAQAKSRLRWTIVALVGYAFLYGFIQFLIPGGAFNQV